MAARKLSPTLATVVEELELEQPSLVTAAMLSEIVSNARLGTQAKIVAARLREAGWLLPTGQRGVWEFAPGAHAGPIGHGDPTLGLQVLMAAHPRLNASLALGTAAWAHGYADRVPRRIDIAVPVGARLSPTLRRNASVVTFTSRLDSVVAKGVPCHRPESVLAHLATSPQAVRSWESVLEWLPDLVADIDPSVLATEAEGRTRASLVRLGYLLSGLRPEVAASFAPVATEVVRFGSRTGALLRYDSAWQVMDHLLPSDPTTWEPVG